MPTHYGTALAVHLLFALFSLTNCRKVFADNIPNSRNVVLNGSSVFGLGHSNIDNRIASPSRTNPFGRECENDLNANGRSDMVNIWGRICNSDPDGDGFTNGEELCDPECTWEPGDDDPECGAGLVLQHPGLLPGDTGTGGADPFVRLHGTLMMLAWLLFAPIGVLVAVTNKNNPSGSITWFHIHRLFMATTFAFTLGGFYVMYDEIGLSDLGIHVSYGFVIVGLVSFQLVNGFLKPLKYETRVRNGYEYVRKSDLRIVWEVLHQWSGRIAVILSIFAIVTGLREGYTDEGSSGGQILAILIFCLLYISGFIYKLFFDKEVPPPLEPRPQERKHESPNPRASRPVSRNRQKKTPNTPKEVTRMVVSPIANEPVGSLRPLEQPSAQSPKSQEKVVLQEAPVLNRNEILRTSSLEMDIEFEADANTTLSRPKSTDPNSPLPPSDTSTKTSPPRTMNVLETPKTTPTDSPTSAMTKQRSWGDLDF